MAEKNDEIGGCCGCGSGGCNSGGEGRIKMLNKIRRQINN
jgi:hypothetical protein